MRLTALCVAMMSLYGCAGMQQPTPGRMTEVLSGAQKNVQAANSGQSPVVPKPLMPHIEQDKLEGKRNSTLNNMRAGVTAWSIGEPSFAQVLFADAYDQIETVYANNPEAKKARSKFHAESVKDFKGEPYERAMVGYYRGLSELALGDLSNAKASFAWGEFQDTMSADETYRSDMALLNFLQAWTSNCNNQENDAKEFYKRAQEARPTLKVPTKSDNLLLIAEVSGAPVKYSTGKYREELRFKAGIETEIDSVKFAVNDTDYNSSLAEDLLWQASTRGGRPIDAILAGKASFKAGAETVSNVASTVTDIAITTSTIQSLTGNYDNAMSSMNVAGAGFLLNMGASIVASATKPEADIRAWETLPARVYLSTTSIEDLPKKITAHINDTSQIPMKVYSVKGCYVAWARDTAPMWRAEGQDAWINLEQLNQELTNKKNQEIKEEKQKRTTELKQSVISTF